jgi:ABC-2 type transport system ATP-binding protein
VVLNSHLLGEVEDVCDRVAILYRGRLRCSGRLSDLLERGDVDELQFRGLSPAAAEEVAGEVRRRGGEVVASSHPRRTLEEFFLETVREARGGTGGAGRPKPEGKA